MATVKFWQGMDKASNIVGADKMMIGKEETGEAQYVDFQDANQFLSIQGIEMKPVPAGALPAGPTGETRTMEILEAGTWTYGGNSFVNPEGSIMKLWWDGTTWSLGSSVPLPTSPTSDVVVKDGTVATSQGGVYAFVDGKTVQLTHGKNFYNPANSKKNQLITNAGTIGVQNGWSWSGLIDISMVPDYSYLYKEGDGNREGLAFFPKAAADQELPTGGRYFGTPLNGAYQKLPGDYFIAFNEISPTANSFTKAMLSVGTTAQPWEAYIKLVPEGSVEGLSDAVSNASDALDISSTNKVNLEAFVFDKKVSDNFLNPAKKVNNSLLDLTTGAFINSPSYNGLGPTPCEPSTSYIARKSNNSVLNLRQIVYFNAAGGVISSISANTSAFTTPSGCRSYKAAIAKTEGEDFSQFGIMKSGGSWVPYKEVMAAKVVDDTPTLQKEGDDLCTIDDAKNIAGSSQSKGLFNWVIDALGNMSLDYGNGDTIAGMVANNRGYTGNNMFNFNSSVVNNVSVGSADDVAPQHIMGLTIAANHGKQYQVATIANHGFTNTIIGTEWTKDSVKYYPIRIINSNQIAFLAGYTGTESNFTFGPALTVGAITYNGNSYNITAILNGTAQQLYPSIGVNRLETFVDGFKTALGKSGSAKTLEVVEEYDVFNPANVLDRIKARAGQAQDPDFTGNVVNTVRNTYSFKGNFSCVITSEVFFRQVVTFQNLMISQAVRIGGTPSYYLPNSNVIGTVDLRTPNQLPISSSFPNIYIRKDNNDPAHPPMRLIQYSGNVGFMIGYYPGKNDFSKTVNLFEIRGDSGKTYPHTYEAPPLNADTSVGDYFSSTLYRSIADLDKVKKDGRMSYFIVHGTDETLIFVDYSASMLDNIVIDDCPYLNGKSLEVINSRNATLISKVFNQGLIVNANYVTNQTTFIEIRVK